VKQLAKLFTSKSYGDDLYPPVSDLSSRNAGLLTNSMPFVNYMFFTNTPYWQNLQGLKSLLDWYHTNPIFYAVVMIKAREYSNMRLKVVSRKDVDQKEELPNTKKVIPAKLYALLNKPNVLQSKWEFFMQRKIFEEVCGNSFTYGNFALGMQKNINTIAALWNVWPSCMNFKLAGKYFEATNINEIISEWKFEYGNYKKIWTPDEVMHKNKPNTRIEDGLIFGRSPAQSMVRALTNIDMAYESRNVIMRNRGMRMMVSSAKSDASGTVALDDDEKGSVHEAMKEYGTLEGQKQFFFSPVPLNAVQIDQDVFKLGLFEEIATDAMTVSNGYGVPEVLLKLYIKGATFENQMASVRRLYQGTIIPEADDEVIALNNFLGLHETDWMLLPDFDHVAALQEDQKMEAEKLEKEKKIAMDEVGKGLITREEYRERMGYGPMPKTETEETTQEENGNQESETEDQ
jgi:hypothetical protein